jgi:hypothetical protein
MERAGLELLTTENAEKTPERTESPRSDLPHLANDNGIAGEAYRFCLAASSTVLNVGTRTGKSHVALLMERAGLELLATENAEKTRSPRRRLGDKKYVRRAPPLTDVGELHLARKQSMAIR